jgi:hypothetical protein
VGISYFYLFILLCIFSSNIKATVVIAKIAIPAYTCGSLSMGKAKQNNVKFAALVKTAIHFVNFEPLLSIETRLSKPEKMIAIPAPMNQSVVVFIYNGNAKLICTIPRRIMK